MCSKLLRLCTIFSISVFLHTLTSSLHFASMTSNVVNYAGHPPDLPLSVGQERSAGDVLSGSAGRVSLLPQGSLTIMLHLDEHLRHNFLSPATAVEKYCNEHVWVSVCACVCLSVCLSASISPEPHARSLQKCLCIMPIAVVGLGQFTVVRPHWSRGVT